MISVISFKCYDCQADLSASSDNIQGVVSTADYDAAIQRHRDTDCPVWLAIKSGDATVLAEQSVFTVIPDPPLTPVIPGERRNKSLSRTVKFRRH